MAHNREEQYFQQGKELVRTYLMREVTTIQDAKEARFAAQESLNSFAEAKVYELEAAAKRFKLLQRIEFLVGALTLLQMAVFLLRGEPYILPLIGTTAATAVLYVVVALLDSKAKRTREALQGEIRAAKKAKFRNDPTGSGIIIEFS